MARTKQINAQKTTKKPAVLKKKAKAKAELKKPAEGEVAKKKRRPLPGTKALQEIRKYQASTDPIIPKLPFQRLVKEITHGFNNELRFSKDAMTALQDAAEKRVVHRMMAAYAKDCSACRPSKKDLKKGASPLLTVRSLRFMNAWLSNPDDENGPPEFRSECVKTVVNRRKRSVPQKKANKVKEEPEKSGDAEKAEDEPQTKAEEAIKSESMEDEEDGAF